MKHNLIRTLFSALVLAALFLAGCQAATPTVISPSARTTTPGVITIQAPPAGTSINSISAQLAQKCADAEKVPMTEVKRNYTLEPLSGIIYEPGKSEKINQQRISFFYSPYAEQIKTLVCIYETSIRKFSYTDSIVEAHQRLWQVRLVEWKTGQVVDEIRLAGGEPGTMTMVGKDTTIVYGAPPSADLANFLTGKIGDQPKSFRGIEFFSLSPDEKTLVLAPKDKEASITLVDIATWGIQEISLPDSYGAIFQAVLSSDSKRIAFTGVSDPRKSTVKRVMAVYDLAQKKIVRQVVTSQDPFTRDILAWSPDGRQVWFGLCSWEVEGSGDTCTPFLNVKGSLVFINPDSTLGFIYSESGKSFELWDLVQKRKAESMPVFSSRDSSNPMKTISPDKNLVVSQSQSPALIVWSIQEGRKVAELQGPTSCQSPGVLALSPDNKWLAAACGTQIWLVDWRKGMVAQVFNGHTPPNIQKLSFSGGPAPLLISRGLDGLVKAWDIAP